jgi:hypothetical protein
VPSVMLCAPNPKPGPRRALSCVRRSSRAATRTLPAKQPSNSVTDAHSRARSLITEVTDGLCLVVARPVLHRFICGDADHRIDVHVRFSVRAIGARSKTRASRIVGRLLTRRDRCADRRPRLFESDAYAAPQKSTRLERHVSMPVGAKRASSSTRSPAEAGLFFCDVETRCQQQRRTSSNTAWLG